METNLEIFKCAYCGMELERSSEEYRKAAKRKIAWPFCSQRCIGKYGAYVRRYKSRRVIGEENIDPDI